jgi:uncharacterized membrane protein YhiD involved in acid resistance
LEAGLAVRVADLLVAGLVNVSHAGVRDLLADVVIDGLAAGFVVLFPNRFLNGLHAAARVWAAAALGSTKVAGRRTTRRWAAAIALRPAEPRVDAVGKER